MKITAGLGSVEDYPAYAAAGADEVFIGYVPMEWARDYGQTIPLNRREVLYYNVQIGSASELQILADMRVVYRVPVAIALNGLSYPPKLYPKILDIIRDCVQLGFDTFIVADPGLLWYFKEHLSADDPASHAVFQISGELGAESIPMARVMKELGASRLIFHRKLTTGEMKAIVEAGDFTEYEAFAMNENCCFHGAFCQSLHADELCHACRIPYESETFEEGAAEYVPGASGCGLCALWRLREAGITHLKVVGRGNYTEDMLKDIAALKKAREILAASKTEAEYKKAMKETVFRGKCSGSCYYMEVAK